MVLHHSHPPQGMGMIVNELFWWGWGSFVPVLVMLNAKIYVVGDQTSLYFW